jgi:hypothetical protein
VVNSFDEVDSFPDDAGENDFLTDDAAYADDGEINVEGLPLTDVRPLNIGRRLSATELAVGKSESLVSVYGSPLPAAEAAAACPPGDGGLIFHAQLVDDDWTHPKHTDAEGNIKPRRPNLPVRASDFFRSLVQTDDGRWLFSGVLNGWPALTCLEVRSITVLGSWLGRKRVVRFWDAARNEAKGADGKGADGKGASPAPSFPPVGHRKSVRVTLRAAPWTARGWSPDSPGCVWWFEAQRRDGKTGAGEPRRAPRLRFGTGMLRGLRSDLAAGRWGGVEPTATIIHRFAHRYARPGRGGRETRKQRVTYHGAILLEWSHGEFCTVVELATLNGVGGRQGKANWYSDKMAESPALYRAMPPTMIMPWKGQFAEIRVHDVEARNLEEFKAFVDAYTGPELRFLDPHVATVSSPVRLHHRRQTDVQQYLLNYMGRDRRYRQEFRSCQTFAADFYGFMAGKAESLPFHAVNRALYQDRRHNFLYAPEMYGPPHQ